MRNIGRCIRKRVLCRLGLRRWKSVGRGRMRGGGGEMRVWSWGGRGWAGRVNGVGGVIG